MDNSNQFSDSQTLARQEKSANILVAIDSGITDASWLAQGVQPNAEVLLLDPKLDGIEQITRALENSPSIASLHIVSHGQPGRLFLGQTQLSLDTLNRYQEDLKNWSKHLQGNSLILYGCQVAQGVGRHFLNRVHQLTGANITASEHLVGNAKLGGSWNLNIRIADFLSSVSSTIEKLAFLPEYTQTYAGVLTQVSISTSTSFDGDDNALIEDQGTLLTVNFNLDEPAPAGGLRVFVDSNVEQIVNRLNLPSFAFNPEVENIDSNSLRTSFDNSGFALTIDQGATSGSFTIPIFDNPEPDTFLPETFDGRVDAVFSLKTQDEVSAVDAGDITNISDYTIDPAAGSSTVIFVDTASQLGMSNGDNPVVSFSTTPELISEADGTNLVMNFSVEGEIPEEGITVNLEGDAARILQQFTVAQTRFDAETGNIFYRFDNSFANNVNGNIVGGILERFSLEDGDPSEAASDEAAAGDGFLSDFSFTITEPTASITIPVLDDIIEEADQTFTYNLVSGEGYEVDPDTNSGTFTVTDGVPGGVGPTVGVTAEPTTLIESEQTPLTVTFTLDEAPPAEGLLIDLQGDVARAIAEFDVNASNPRDPEDEIEIVGPVVSGGNIAGTNETASAVFFRMTEQVATVTIPVFEDNIPEGTETINFSLLDGELYQVDPDASDFTVTIEDGVVSPEPVVSFSTTPELISEADGTNLVMNFSVEGEIPAEGITVNLEGDTPEILQQFLAPDGDGAVQTRVTADGNLLYRFDTSFEADNSNFGNITGGILEVFALEDGDPAEDNSDPAAAGTGFLSNFSFTITSPTASITLPVLDDLLQEADQTFTYTLADGEGYEVDGETNSGTFTVTDGVDGGDGPTVGVTAEPTTLVESDQTRIELEFTASEPVPPEGLVVTLQGDVVRGIGEFDVNASNPRDSEDEITIEGPVVTGGNIVGTDETVSSLVFRMTEQTSTLSVAVFEDSVSEGTETINFNLLDGELYEVDPDASGFTVTIEDGETDPVVSFSTTPGVISEAEGTNLVMNFSVDGEIPEEGITVNLEGDAARILQEFTVAQTRFNDDFELLYRFDRPFANGDDDPVADNEFVQGGILDLFAIEDGDPDPDASDEAAAGDGFLSNFSFTITEPTASITIPVFDDLIEEADETFTYTLVGGEGYDTTEDANSGTFTVTDGVPAGIGPTVGVTAAPTTLVEQDQTRIELTFSVEGDIPAEGLVVALEGDVLRGIGEFDVNASNPRDPEDEITIEGPVVTGGNIVGTDETVSSLLFRITENTATLSVAVFEDIVPEGTETINFNLLDGELYQVDADASSFSVTIEDGGIIGTADADTIVGDDTDNGIDALAGDDLVAGGLGNDVILGGDGDDVLRGDANSRASSTGMGGDDIIFGGTGNDRIGGKDGNDLLSGDEGDDIIFGDAGDDTIMGVTGNDTLTGDDFSGGSGSDLFVFGNGDGTDTITDFEVGTDMIGLVEGELTFEALEIIEIDGNAAISVMETGETLAVLNGVDSDELTADAFVITPDVSSLNDLV